MTTSFSPINYLIDLDTENEALKKAFYQSVAATKAMNAGRINGTLSEYLWHPSVFLPNTLWAELIEPYMENLRLANNNELFLAYFSSFIVHFTWRYSKSIYRFDDYTFDCLSTSPAGKYLDYRLLMNLPEGSLYIEFSKPLELQGKNVYGFHAILNFQEKTINELKNRAPNQLILLFNTHNPFSKDSLKALHAQPVLVLDIHRSGKINQQISYIYGVKYETQDELNDLFAPYLSLLTALCTDEIEIDNFSKNSVKPVVKQKPSYKDNENLFWNKGKTGKYHATSPTNPKNWRVGVTYGVNYRQARSAQQIAEQSKARLIGLHWTTHIVDFEIRLKLMPPKLSNEHYIHEQLDEFVQNFDFKENL
ncbi:hypothetical protein [Acinetobacter gyllenbergii]|uniref:hypothetical protein n=1 Tax=Acinetobacter gyllenbergii TaxID=134534 RepID=UPI003F558B7D